MYQTYIKRLFDFLAAIIALLILSPVFIVVTVFLMFSNKGKPFFFQYRPGKNGKIFRIIKFKSMTDKTDSEGVLLPFDQRITPVGNFIRKYSIDEIPQLLNVVMGDMSLIGPRPLLVDYLPLYNKYQSRRHEVRPGISGWAQVNGRNALNWDQKFDLDIYYVDHSSFVLDFKILLMTVKKVIFKEGVNQEDNLNMPDFTGNSPKHA